MTPETVVRIIRDALMVTFWLSAPLLAINTGDDLINPPELGILQREIGRVAHGRAVLIPADTRTVGHSTHTKAAVWKEHLVELLSSSQH